MASLVVFKVEGFQPVPLDVLDVVVIDAVAVGAFLDHGVKES